VDSPGATLQYRAVVTYLILGSTMAFANAVQPGPFQTYLISQTLAHGWRRTAPACLAPLLSDGPIIALTLLVLSHVSPQLQAALRAVGGLFLLWLAAGAYRSWTRDRTGGVTDPGSTPRSVVNAAVVNLLNPNPWLGWSLVLGPLLLKGWREAPAHGVALVASFYVTMTVTLAAIVGVVAAARNAWPRLVPVLLAVSAAVLAGLGCYQLYAGISALYRG
jgi:threonine/homoserine/homoserine lactone efflux protein